MNKETEPLNPDHLDWLVKNRGHNQGASAKLFRLLNEYPKQTQEQRGPIRYDAQTLVAIAFSLWRAAFLAGRSNSGTETAKHAKSFLGEMLENNAILYSNEKSARNWACNYYLANARYRLREYRDKHKGFRIEESLLEIGSKLPAKKRWEDLQSAFDDAIAHFELRLK